MGKFFFERCLKISNFIVSFNRESNIGLGSSWEEIRVGQYFGMRESEVGETGR